MMPHVWEQGVGQCLAESGTTIPKRVRGRPCLAEGSRGFLEDCFHSQEALEAMSIRSNAELQGPDLSLSHFEDDKDKILAHSLCFRGGHQQLHLFSLVPLPSCTAGGCHLPKASLKPVG